MRLSWWSASSTTAAAAFAGSHRTRFSDRHVPAAVVGAVEFLDRVRSFLIGGHLDKSEALASARVAIGDDLGGLNGSGLSKDLFERLVGRVKWEITYIQLLTH